MNKKSVVTIIISGILLFSTMSLITKEETIVKGGDVLNDKVWFGAVTDQHYGQSDQPSAPNEDETVEDWFYNPSLPEMDFVFSSIGDWMSDKRGSSYSDPRDACQKIADDSANHYKLPYFWVLGNHDNTNYEYDTEDEDHLLKSFEMRKLSGTYWNNYAFMYNNVLFIGLGETTGQHDISNFQEGWLLYLLDRYSTSTTVIITHQMMPDTTYDSYSNSNEYRLYNDMDFW